MSISPIHQKADDFSDYVFIDFNEEHLRDPQFVKFVQICSVKERDRTLKWDLFRRKYAYDGIPKTIDMLSRLRELVHQDASKYVESSIVLCKKVAASIGLQVKITSPYSNPMNQALVRKVVEWMQLRIGFAGEIIQNKNNHAAKCFPAFDSWKLERGALARFLRKGELFLGQIIRLDGRWTTLDEKLITKLDSQEKFLDQSSAGHFARLLKGEEIHDLEDWLNEEEEAPAGASSPRRADSDSAERGTPVSASSAASSAYSDSDSDSDDY